MFMQEKVSEINKRLKLLENVSHVVVWGAGEHTCRLFEKTDLLSYSIKDIVDMDEKKQGCRYFGFRIKGSEEVKWGEAGAAVISVPGKEKEIAKMLKGLGFQGIIVSLYEDGRCIPFYRLYDENVPAVRYLGDYDSWESAEKECMGYGDTVIIEKVINSTEKVVAGEAAWERDSYLFYEQKYVYGICAAILRCAVQNGSQGVRVLDLGGALGSTYFQNREYLSDVENLEYIVAEQDVLVEYGHKNLENGVLRFISSGENYTDYGRFDIAIMSASLQYIPQYKEMISKILAIKPHYIILDRILVSDRHRICRETVPEEIYKSSYPVMIFRESEIIEFFRTAYELVEKDISSVPEWAYFEDGRVESKMYVFRRVEEKN